MKRMISLLSATIISGALVGSAAASEVISQERLAEDYCHTIYQEAAGKGITPDAKDEYDVVDFYGPCDEPARGWDQAIEEERAEYFRFGRDYES